MLSVFDRGPPDSCQYLAHPLLLLAIISHWKSLELGILKVRANGTILQVLYQNPVTVRPLGAA